MAVQIFDGVREFDVCATKTWQRYHTYVLDSGMVVLVLPCVYLLALYFIMGE